MGDSTASYVDQSELRFNFDVVLLSNLSNGNKARAQLISKNPPTRSEKIVVLYLGWILTLDFINPYLKFSLFLLHLHFNPIHLVCQCKSILFLMFLTSLALKNNNKKKKFEKKT